MSPTQKVGESVSAEEINEIDRRYEAPVEPDDDAMEDVDVDGFLAAATAVAGAVKPIEVRVGDRMLRFSVAAINEGDEYELRRAARRPKKGKPSEMEFSWVEYRKLYIARSLSKASGRTVNGWELDPLPAGVLNQIQLEVLKLSGYDVENQGQQGLDPTAFLS